MIKQYLQVTKPGIIFGNLISVIGGFLLAAKGSIDFPLFLATLVGVALVRVLLIGPVEDFRLYNIDFLFGAAILLVGTVSLYKAMRANTRREIALRSGETSSW